MKTVKDYYKTRFDRNETFRKNMIWKTLSKCFFQKYINKRDTVIDIGAGYCEFINNIKSGGKIAVDINPETKKNANKNVKVVNYQPKLLRKRMAKKANVVFISNFLEHLSSKEDVIEYIETAYKILKPGGRIIVMQPNIKLAKEKYWDFIDHKIALTDLSIVEALKICDFKIEKVVKRFLPYTTKNSIPVFPWMICIYLKLPGFLRLGAGQSLFIAKKKK